MAHLIQPLTDVGNSSSAQGMYRSTSRSSQFVHDALMPFGYPMRVFNIFHSRGLSVSTVTDGVGERNGHVLVCRCPWRFEHIKYPPLRPLYKEKKQELFLPQMNPFNPHEI